MPMMPNVPLRLIGAALLAAMACARSSAPPVPRPSGDSVDVGYGSQSKEKTTGAVTSLKGSELGDRPVRIEELLRGKVAGLQIIPVPGGASFRIRGTDSMLADQEPLVVVDGIQIPSGNINSALAGLSREDIKRVSVLKDVASTSIYGLRGAGGVILIVTKR
jgi:TonB-dependent SusC/RagA subfamily outer membrane receptor